MPIFLIILVYFIAGLLAWLVVRAYPKRFGVAGELLEMILLFNLTAFPLDALLGLALWFFWPVAIAIGVFVPSLTLNKTISSSASPLAEKQKELLGATGECATDLAPTGKVRIGESIHDAISSERFTAKSTIVEVTGLRGFNLLVKPATQQARGENGEPAPASRRPAEDHPSRRACR